MMRGPFMQPRLNWTTLQTVLRERKFSVVWPVRPSRFTSHRWAWRQPSEVVRRRVGGQKSPRSEGRRPHSNSIRPRDACGNLACGRGSDLLFNPDGMLVASPFCPGGLGPVSGGTTSGRAASGVTPLRRSLTDRAARAPASEHWGNRARVPGPFRREDLDVKQPSST